MYSDFYTTTVLPTTSGPSTWTIISIVLAIIGGIAAYVFFVAPKNDGKYNGFLAWLHEFLNFKNFFIEVIFKVLYIICALFITLNAFNYIGQDFAKFFLTLVLGNIFIRIGYELLLMLITVVNNTTEINRKLGSSKKEAEKTASKTKRKDEDE